MLKEPDLLTTENIQQRARESASTLAWCYGVLAARGVQPAVDSELRRLLTAPLTFRDREYMAGIDIFTQLQNAIDRGAHWEKFPVGTILPDTWTDPETKGIYYMPLRIVDYRKVALPGGRKALGATLLRVNASPNDIVFDPYNNRFNHSQAKWHLDGNYLTGCSAELRAAMATVVVDVTYGDACDQACCQAFLPSPEELHVDVDKGYLEGALDHYSWEYFLDTPTDRHEPCEKRVFRTPNGKSKCVWTRSRDTSDTVCLMTTNGNIYGEYPSRSYSILPACVITGRQPPQTD